MANLLPFISKLYIVDKSGQEILLGDVMTPPQRDLLLRVNQDITENKASRYIILKARQIGMSTMIQGIHFALAMSKQNFQGLVIAHENDSSAHLLKMNRFYFDTFWAKEAFPTKYAAQNQLAWQHVNSHIKIATAKNMRAGRSQTLQFLHASEVAFWDNADLMMTGLQQTVGRRPGTFIFLESTANGVGGFYYSTWEAALAGDVQYVPLFYPWWAHPEYTAHHIGLGHMAQGTFLPADDEERHLIKFLRSDRVVNGQSSPAMDPDEIKSRLVWRREILGTECQGDLNKLHQEFPSDPEEAFIATGANAFDMSRLKKIFEPMEGEIGRLVDEGSKVRFIKDLTGPLEVYRFPSDSQVFGWYMIGGDGKKSTQAVSGSPGDHCCAQVLNRKTWEQVARLRCRLDQNMFGEEMIKLGRFYNNATLAPETGLGGPGVAAHIIARGYPHVYQHRKHTKMPGQVDNTWGWITNAQTKAYAIGNLQSALYDATEPTAYDRGIGIRIHDRVTYNEMRNYVTLPGGGYGNEEGKENFDDTVMALGIALSCTKDEAAMMQGDPQYEAPRYHEPAYKSNLSQDQVRNFEDHLTEMGIPEGGVMAGTKLEDGMGEDAAWLEDETPDSFGGDWSDFEEDG